MSRHTESSSACSIAAHPCKKRKDGAPSVGTVYTNIAKAGLPGHTRWLKSHIAPTAVLCFWLSAGHPLAMATQTILIVYSDHVIIGADSLFNGGAASSPRKGCKIRQSGSFFWTAAGVNSSADKRFDIDKLIS